MEIVLRLASATTVEHFIETYEMQLPIFPYLSEFKDEIEFDNGLFQFTNVAPPLYKQMRNTTLSSSFFSSPPSVFLITTDVVVRC